MPPTRRPGTAPDAQDLDELAQAPGTAGRLRKAPASDPVLGAASTPTGTTVEVDTSLPPPKRAAARPARSKPTTPATKSKVGFYQDPGHTGRARAAYEWTRLHEGHRSFSDFVAAALMREVARLEAAYHDSQPWPPLEPGELPTGKPLGS